MGTTAAAQSQPTAREPQYRQVIVPHGPNEPVPEIRVAARVLTVFRFNAPIDRASLEVEGRTTRFRLVDGGEYLLGFEPATEPGPGEKVGVKVRYKDGASPGYALFALVSHPSLVDKEVEVVRRLRSPEALEAELARCEEEGPARLVLSGRLDIQGVQAQRIRLPLGSQSGLELQDGIGYRASSWALVSVLVHNLPGQPPWTAAEARLTRADGTPVKVLSVRMDKPQLAPGERGLLVVETGRPVWEVADALRLEVREKGGGRPFVIDTVRF